MVLLEGRSHEKEREGFGPRTLSGLTTPYFRRFFLILNLFLWRDFGQTQKVGKFSFDQ